ncbi:AEC family transporter [Anaerosacchariphilus polymeriproducens]|uniref:AEC family transporter n=1 Tax=Anaerosacchariphilus polymeriproducens TaxID=1812858 RepID=A0A371AT96_9FIRM|nr:AEC family transporter [Anaerosacchariphilus polymeriproducens]RDU22793.1 AEC family transporter [Anaerosacchariphilus polymeriproducens]
MSDFIFSLTITIPIFLIIFFGWFLKKAGIFSTEFTKSADKYIFKAALPLLLFKDIATANIQDVFRLKFVLYCLISTTIMFLGVWFFTSLFMKDKSMVGAFTQASTRGSAAVLGIAFVENIYGNTELAALMIMAAVPLYNIYSVIILTFCSNTCDNTISRIREAFINVLINPIIISIFIGSIFAILKIPIPTIPMKFISCIADTATPIALMVIGAGFEGKQAIAKIKPALTATFIKLIGIPALFFPFTLALGFRDCELVSILVMLGSPTAVTCYIMAKNMGNDYILTSNIVVLATLFSSLSLTLWIFLLKSNGFI